MNDRIQELAQEAEDYADSIVDQGGEFHPVYTQKLAELIIKECAKVASRAENNDNEVRCIEDVITEHFGVER